MALARATRAESAAPGAGPDPDADAVFLPAYFFFFVFLPGGLAMAWVLTFVLFLSLIHI